MRTGDHQIDKRNAEILQKFSHELIPGESAFALFSRLTLGFTPSFFKDSIKSISSDQQEAFKKKMILIYNYCKGATFKTLIAKLADLMMLDEKDCLSERPSNLNLKHHLVDLWNLEEGVFEAFHAILDVEFREKLKAFKYDIEIRQLLLFTKTLSEEQAAIFKFLDFPYTPRNLICSCEALIKAVELILSLTSEKYGFF